MKRANKIRLTESQLHRVVKESVKKMIKETDSYDDYIYGWGDINSIDNIQERNQAITHAIEITFGLIENFVEEKKEELIRRLVRQEPYNRNYYKYQRDKLKI